MWYFAWVLGLGLACAFAILNAMWLELDPRLARDPHADDETGRRPDEPARR
jgi:cytochrome bd-I ubiquinol oxidase subunit X